MVTPAFSHAWIKAEPASMETFFPSIVSSTSACLDGVVAKVLVAAGRATRLALRADRASWGRSMLDTGRATKERVLLGAW